MTNNFLQTLAPTSEMERALLEGSHYHSNFEGWTSARSFIANVIDRSGTILDIGCANGLLLYCLQRWTSKKLVPFGIDTDEDRLVQCRSLLPEWRDNFINLPANHLQNLSQFGLPSKFDLIYWNVWDNCDFTDQLHRDYTHHIYAVGAKGGRVIFGFYDKDPDLIEAKIEWLRGTLGEIRGRLSNIPRREVLIYWDNT